MEPEPPPFDAAGYFGSENDIVDYLNAWTADGSSREIARALGDVARAKGVTEVFLETATAPQPLHPALSRDGNPRLGLLCAVLVALGLELAFKKKAP